MAVFDQVWASVCETSGEVFEYQDLVPMYHNHSRECLTEKKLIRTRK